MNTYRIGEAATATGVTTHTIRFYEARGLLPVATRSEAGYRLYGDSDLRRLRLIHNARTLGLPLDEIQGLVDGLHDSTCADYASRLRSAVDRQRLEIDCRIEELQRVRVELDTLATEAAAAFSSSQQVAECSCCLLMDDRQDSSYCQPSPPALAQRFSNEVLEILQCDIGSRPAAPTPDDLAPFLCGASLVDGQLVIRFVPDALAAVRQFAAAECVCCGGMGWAVDETAEGVQLSVSGTSEQLTVLAAAWPLPEVQL